MNNTIALKESGRRWGLLALSALLCLGPAAGSVCAADASATRVVGKPVAVVNNEPIFADELEKESEPFIERYKNTVPEKDQSPEKLAKLKKEILDRLVEEKLLLQEAKKQKIKVSKVDLERGIEQFKEPFNVDEQGKQRGAVQAEQAFQDQLQKEGLTQEQFNKRVEEQIMKMKLIEFEIKSKVKMPADDEVKKFYDKVQDKIAGKAVQTANQKESDDLDQITKYIQHMSGEQVRLRHILVRSKSSDNPEQRAAAKKKIDDILQKVKDGQDFAFLAKKYSEDPISKDRGGELGFIAKGDLGLPQIDEAAFKMKEGDVSGVIQTEIGYHVIKLVEKKSPHPIELDDIRDDLRNYMAQKIYEQKLEKYLKSLRAGANITVNTVPN